MVYCDELRFVTPMENDLCTMIYLLKKITVQVVGSRRTQMPWVRGSHKHVVMLFLYPINIIYVALVTGYSCYVLE